MRWPIVKQHGRYTTTDEAGMWVYAYWLADYDTSPIPFGQERDPFVRCHGPEYTVMLPRPAQVASPLRQVMYPTEKEQQYVAPLVNDAIERGNYLRSVLDAGRPILAAVCLGSSSHAYALAGDRSRYWYAERNDLTRAGQRLLRRLDKLYGSRLIQLVTYVDVD